MGELENKELNNETVNQAQAQEDKHEREGSHGHGNPEDKKDLGSFVKDKKDEYIAEFKRIVWPSREDLIKQSLAVVFISLVFGVYIILIDGLFSQAWKFILSLFGL